jgi:hypothetical protein
MGVVPSLCGPALRQKTKRDYLGSGVVKTKVCVVGLNVWPLYHRAFVVVHF